MFIALILGLVHAIVWWRVIGGRLGRRWKLLAYHFAQRWGLWLFNQWDLSNWARALLAVRLMIWVTISRVQDLLGPRTVGWKLSLRLNIEFPFDIFELLHEAVVGLGYYSLKGEEGDGFCEIPSKFVHQVCAYDCRTSGYSCVAVNINVSKFSESGIGYLFCSIKWMQSFMWSEI